MSTSSENEGESEPRRKFVVFIDSLGPRDVAYTDWLKKHCFDGRMDAGVPYVTPKVMGEVYTGENPAVHGLPSVSRYEQPSRTRPTRITLPELAASSSEYGDVCNFGLPFIAPHQVIAENGAYWHASSAMGQQNISPTEAQNHLTVTGPAGDLSNPDEDPDTLFNLRVDYTRQLFGTARSLAEAFDFEVMFISYRILDSYCHYRFLHGPEGSPATDRQLFISEVLDHELEDLTRHGDVFVFGDHGARELEDVFRLNHWLRDHGYLDFEIDDEFISLAKEYGMLEQDDSVPGEVLQTDNPGVTIDEAASVAICDDPFSTGLTLLDGATPERVQELIDDLTATDAIDDVHVTSEMWDGPYLDECPDLYPERRPGVYVSGNLADEKGGPELTRDGVHDPIGVFGATTPLDVPDDPVAPTDLFDLILEQFLGLEKSEVLDGDRDLEFGAPPNQGDVDEQRKRDLRDHLQDLGYI